MKTVTDIVTDTDIVTEATTEESDAYSTESPDTKTVTESTSEQVIGTPTTIIPEEGTTKKSADDDKKKETDIIEEITELPEMTTDFYKSTTASSTVTDTPIEDLTESAEVTSVTESVTDESTQTSTEMPDAKTETSVTDIVSESTTEDATGVTESLLEQCTVNGTVYYENDDIPSYSQCKENCTCQNGKVQCDHVVCPKSSQYHPRCKAIENEYDCCPTYDCGELHRNTIQLFNVIICFKSTILVFMVFKIKITIYVFFSG